MPTGAEGGVIWLIVAVALVLIILAIGAYLERRWHGR